MQASAIGTVGFPPPNSRNCRFLERRRGCLACACRVQVSPPLRCGCPPVCFRANWTPDVAAALRVPVVFSLPGFRGRGSELATSQQPLLPGEDRSLAFALNARADAPCFRGPSWACRWPTPSRQSGPPRVRLRPLPGHLNHGSANRIANTRRWHHPTAPAGRTMASLGDLTWW